MGRAPTGDAASRVSTGKSLRLLRYRWLIGLFQPLLRRDLGFRNRACRVQRRPILVEGGEPILF